MAKEPAFAYTKHTDGFTLNLSEVTSNKDRYNLMIQAFVPRPIAWVLTENENGSYNLAPFSYSAAVAATPMTFMFSCGTRHKKPNTRKDTWANLERTKRCVLHMPSVNNLEAVNNSASGLDIGASEPEAFGIETTPFEGFPLPRVKAAPIAFGCHFKSVTHIGEPPLGLILVEAEKVFMAKHIVADRQNGMFNIDEKAINPLTRLGNTKYGTLGDVLDIGPPPRSK